MSIGYVYVLLNPDTHIIKYVGKTMGSLKQRLACHISNSKKKKKLNKNESWIKHISPQIPLIKSLIESEDENFLLEQEKYFIKFFRDNNIKLTNLQDGGDGNKKGYKFVKRYIPKKGVIPKQLLPYVGSVKGIKKTKEQRERQSYTLKNKYKNGFKHPKLKPIYSINVFSLEKQHYSSLKEASLKLNIPLDSISNSLTGQSLKCRNYVFHYKNQPLKKFKTPIRIKKYKSSRNSIRYFQDLPLKEQLKISKMINNYFVQEMF